MIYWFFSTITNYTIWIEKIINNHNKFQDIFYNWRTVHKKKVSQDFQLLYENLGLYISISIFSLQKINYISLIYSFLYSECIPKRKFEGTLLRTEY